MAQRFNSRGASRKLGRRISAARRAAGLTVTALAAKALVHHSSVSRAERGYFQTVNPSVRKICTVLGIAWEEEKDAPDLALLLSQVERIAAQRPGVAHAISALVSELEANLDP